MRSVILRGVWRSLMVMGFLAFILPMGSMGVEVPITDDARDHFNPQWSPDGQWVVFERVDDNGNHQIYKALATPSGLKEDQVVKEDLRDHFNPRWSPVVGRDGFYWIAYHADVDQDLMINQLRIYVVQDSPLAFPRKRSAEPDEGISLRDHVLPRWSPDGKFLVFERQHAGGVGTGSTNSTYRCLSSIFLGSQTADRMQDVFLVAPEFCDKPTNGPSANFSSTDSPVWSPASGSGTIVQMRESPGPFPGVALRKIQVIDFLGGDLAGSTDLFRVGLNQNPEWNITGDKVVFRNAPDLGMDGEILFLDINDPNLAPDDPAFPTNVSNTLDLDERDPVWNNGTPCPLIAFVREVQGGGFELVVTHENPTLGEEVLSLATDIRTPHFNPTNGLEVVYARKAGASYQIVKNTVSMCP